MITTGKYIIIYLYFPNSKSWSLQICSYVTSELSSTESSSVRLSASHQSKEKHLSSCQKSGFCLSQCFHRPQQLIHIVCAAVIEVVSTVYGELDYLLFHCCFHKGAFLLHRPHKYPFNLFIFYSFVFKRNPSAVGIYFLTIFSSKDVLS